MSDDLQLLELAERVEKASGPDRELDGSIWWATRSPEEIASLDPGGFVRECIVRDGSAGKALSGFYDSSRPHCLANLAFRQAYTASLDAAMTLVPEGWRVVGVAERELGGGWSASLFPRDPDGLGIPRTYEAHVGTLARSEALTGPLALTAACLRAIANGAEHG